MSTEKIIKAISGIGYTFKRFKKGLNYNYATDKRNEGLKDDEWGLEDYPAEDGTDIMDFIDDVIKWAENIESNTSTVKTEMTIEKIVENILNEKSALFSGTPVTVAGHALRLVEIFRSMNSYIKELESAIKAEGKAANSMFSKFPIQVSNISDFTKKLGTWSKTCEKNLSEIRYQAKNAQGHFNR